LEEKFIVNVCRGKIIFDMDGVITGEERYWDSAALVVWELLFHKRFLGLAIPTTLFPFKKDLAPEEIASIRKVIFQNDRVISFFKSRAVNSNWDLAFLTFSFQLVMMFRFLTERGLIRTSSLPWEGSFQLQHLAFFSQLLSSGGKEQGYWFPNFGAILGNWTGEAQGPGELMDRLASLLPAAFSTFAADIFAPLSILWREIQGLFQEWYLGEAIIKKGRSKGQVSPGKRGLIHREEPLLPVEKIKEVLTQLASQGWVLGIATGRPRAEIYAPLKQMGLWPFFDPESVVTYSEVEQAEQRLGEGWNGLLSKPHPFSFLKAYWGNDYNDSELVLKLPLPEEGRCWVVGDSRADLLAAKSMKAFFIGVLTGPGGPESKKLFKKEGAKAVLADITCLPSFFAGFSTPLPRHYP
jgi:phosphoglycolate phosphatase-like HAD superfamily hydrolase